MALLINCSRCGQMHLQGSPCRPEAIFNKQENDNREYFFSLERRIKKLEDKNDDIEKLIELLEMLLKKLKNKK